MPCDRQVIHFSVHRRAGTALAPLLADTARRGAPSAREADVTASAQRDREAALEGRYANHLKVGINATEFVLDFGQYYADDGAARFHTRIVSTPAHLQAFVALLQQCLLDYEQEHGAIAALGGAQ